MLSAPSAGVGHQEVVRVEAGGGKCGWYPFGSKVISVQTAFIKLNFKVKILLTSLYDKVMQR